MRLSGFVSNVVAWWPLTKQGETGAVPRRSAASTCAAHPGDRNRMLRSNQGKSDQAGKNSTNCADQCLLSVFYTASPADEQKLTSAHQGREVNCSPTAFPLPKLLTHWREIRTAFPRGCRHVSRAGSCWLHTLSRVQRRWQLLSCSTFQAILCRLTPRFC